MQIKPQIGFDQIKFGQRKEDVIALLGPPSVETIDDYPDQNTEIILDYDELGLDLTFSSDDDYKLGTITFYEEHWALMGEQFIGLDEKEFLEKIKKTNITDLVIEDDFKDFDARDYFSDSKGISFWIDSGRVDSITIFPKENPNDIDDPVWPE